MNIWSSLSDKEKITIVFAIVGWIIAVWQTKRAYKLKKNSIVFEKRLEIYNEYFGKIDEINERLLINFHEFIGPKLNEVYQKIILTPEESNGAIIEMQKSFSDMIVKVSKNVNQANEELQKLRFISSKKTLRILNKYKELSQKQIELLPKLFDSIDIRNKNYSENAINKELVKIGEKMVKKRDELEQQMRIDLGL